MKFDRYLRLHGETTAGFAARMSKQMRQKVSLGAVSKWRQGQRTPRAPHQKVIDKLTRGKVTFRDWYM